MTYRARRLLMRAPLFASGRRLLKGITFRRYSGQSLYDVLLRVIGNLQRHEIIDRANGVAFNLILAIFPAIIFLFTLTPYLTAYFPRISQENIMAFLSDILPQSMFDVISETVLDIVMIQRGGLLTFGFVVALFLATNGMMALIRAFNACYKTVEVRSAWRTRLTATLLTVLLALVLFLTMALMVAGQVAVDYVSTHLRDLQHLDLDDYSIYLFNLMRFSVVFVGFFLSISCIYYFGPSVHYSWRFVSWGSLIATILSMILSYGFSAYVARFGSYNKLYGSIGVLIALMVWIQMLTFVLLAGYEINATLHQMRRKRENNPEPNGR